MVKRKFRFILSLPLILALDFVLLHTQKVIFPHAAEQTSKLIPQVVPEVDLQLMPMRRWKVSGQEIFLWKQRLKHYIHNEIEKAAREIRDRHLSRTAFSHPIEDISSLLPDPGKFESPDIAQKENILLTHPRFQQEATFKSSKVPGVAQNMKKRGLSIPAMSKILGGFANALASKQEEKPQINAEPEPRSEINFRSVSSAHKASVSKEADHSNVTKTPAGNLPNGPIK